MAGSIKGKVKRKILPCGLEFSAFEPPLSMSKDLF